MESFTPMVEKLGPENAYSMMDEIYEILIHQVHEFEGTVNEMTGDGIMAIFGAPIALEDAPSRALRSALSIHEKISEFNSQENISFPVKMRIGINTGPVIVGTLGNDLRVEFKAVGDTVNLASRMEGLAEPGTTYLTKSTYHLTEGLFEFESLGNKDVKGKSKSIPVYKLKSSKKDIYRPRIGFERMIYSEMVGRDSEIAKIELQIMKAINGEGSVVNIIGEAGIGKSRLISELKDKDVVKKITILEGRSISIGRNLSYYPIANLLKHWAQIEEDDGETKALNKLENSLRKVCGEKYQEILPFVAIPMGIRLSGRYAETVKEITGEAFQKNILKNMKEFLENATKLTPLVIVMEDLHWADTTSIELLESLFRMSQTLKIVFINVFRPGYKETGDRIIESLKRRSSTYSLNIKLSPLDEKNSNILINNMLNIKGFHRKTKDIIIQRSDGNPFYIEEVVRSFIDQGALVKRGRAFETTDKINSIAVPLTINDVLMSRIDQLEEKTRDLMKVASVIGRNFFRRILLEVAETVQEDIDDKIDHLKTIQFIREQKRMDEIEYLFKHALAQEATYESILLKKRKNIHIKVAQSIESIFKERIHEFYGMLAFHYSNAGVEEKSEEYLIKAGEEALKSSASSEALNYYKDALKLYLKNYGDTADHRKVAMLEKNIAIAYFNRGQYFESSEYLTKVLAYFGVKEYRNTPLGKFILFLKLIYFVQGIYTPFFRWKKKPSQDDNEINELMFMKAQSLSTTNSKKYFFEMFNYSNRIIRLDITKLEKGDLILGAYGNVLSYGGISFGLAKRILILAKNKIDKKSPHNILIFEFALLVFGYLSGENEFIKDYNSDLLNQNSKNIDVVFVAYISFHLRIKLELGLNDEVKKITNKLHEISNLYENELGFICIYFYTTLSLIKWRKFDQALMILEKGINYIENATFNRYMFIMYSMKAEIQISINDIEEAEKSLNYANELKSKLSSPPDLSRHYLRSDFLLYLYQLEESIKKGSVVEVAKIKNKCVKIGKKAINNSSKVAFEQTEIYRLMGKFYQLIGKPKKAIKWFRKSIEVGERLNARLELSRTYFEVGKQLLESEFKYSPKNKMNAKDYFEKAEIMFKEMDLQWDLEQLERVRLENQYI